MMRRRIRYFAYGANLSPAVMQYRCKGRAHRRLGPASLPGYQLEFRGNRYGFGKATVALAPGREVPGGLWLIGRRCRRALSVYEGYPRIYTRKWVRVLTEGRRVWAMLFVLRIKRPLSPPDGAYLNTILKGYAEFGLDPDTLLRAAEAAGSGASGQTPPPIGSPLRSGKGLR